MKYEKWTVAPPDPAALAALEEAGISPLLAAVLSARGVRVPQEARALLAHLLRAAYQDKENRGVSVYVDVNPYNS